MTEPADPWLQPWLALVRERAGSVPVRELGCGSGRDTATLVQAGCKVVGVDLSVSAIAQACEAVPEAQLDGSAAPSSPKAAWKVVPEKMAQA